MMIKQTITSIVAIILFTILTGFVYPLFVTLIGQVIFSYPANGSLIVQNGQIVGSELIGQPFSDPKYFWSRPSATAPAYNGAASSGSNLGPLNPALTDGIKKLTQSLKDADPGNTQAIPVDLVTASGSGLDPHISPAAAAYQAGRVARVRGIDAEKVQQLIRKFTAGRQLGILGEPGVNVVQLNRALDTESK